MKRWERIKQYEGTYIKMLICGGKTVLLRHFFIPLRVWLYHKNQRMITWAARKRLPGSASQGCLPGQVCPVRGLASTNDAHLISLSHDQQQWEWQHGSCPRAFAEVWRPGFALCWPKPRPVSIRCRLQKGSASHYPWRQGGRSPPRFSLHVASLHGMSVRPRVG